SVGRAAAECAAPAGAHGGGQSRLRRRRGHGGLRQGGQPGPLRDRSLSRRAGRAQGERQAAGARAGRGVIEPMADSNPRQRSSIRRTLTLVMTMTSVAVLLVACLAFLLHEQLTYRGALAADLTALADVIGSNSTAALAFKDPNAARDALAALKAEHDV